MTNKELIKKSSEFIGAAFKIQILALKTKDKDLLDIYVDSLNRMSGVLDFILCPMTEIDETGEVIPNPVYSHKAEVMASDAMKAISAVVDVILVRIVELGE